MKEIYLEQILYAFCNGENAIAKSNVPFVLKAMKEACKYTLELAAENSEINSTETSDDSSGFIFEVDKQSILDTINQVK